MRTPTTTHHTDPGATSVPSIAFPHMWVIAADAADVFRQDAHLAGRIYVNAEVQFIECYAEMQGETGGRRALLRRSAQRLLSDVRAARERRHQAVRRMLDDAAYRVAERRVMREGVAA